MVTTILDLLGSLLLVIGIAWGVALLTAVPPAGFIVAGILLLVLSFILTKRGAR